MTYPTASLLAQYEPWRWSIADNTTYDAGSNIFTDSSGNGNHLTTVVGAPKHRTSILNGMAAARFDGSTATVSNNSLALTSAVTIAGLIIPRALGGSGFHAYSSFNNGSGATAAQQGYHATNNHAFGYDGSNTFDGTTLLVVGTAYVLTCIYAPSTQSRLRLNGAEENNSSTPGALPAMARFTVGASLGSGANPMQVDVCALFLYSVSLHGTQALTDLETYLTHLQTVGAPQSYTDTLDPASYTLTGQALKQGYGQSLTPASYALTGQSVTEVTGGGLLGGHGGAQWTPQPGGRR